MRRSIWRQLFTHLILLIGLVVMCAPILLILSSSTHDTLTLARDGLQLWPGSAAGENYATVLTLQAGFTDQITAREMLKNSLIVAGGIATLTTCLSLMAAYAIVYFRLPLAQMLFWATMLTLLLPLEARFIPTFATINAFGLVNSFAGMILPALALALGTLFFRQLLLRFPEEYLEAATLDGAGPLRFFWDFIIPLSWRRGGAIFVVSFMIGWNLYLWSILITTDESRYTLVRGIRLIGQESGPGLALMALSILPPLILVIIFQRWFFRALSENGSPV